MGGRGGDRQRDILIKKKKRDKAKGKGKSGKRGVRMNVYASKRKRWRKRQIKSNTAIIEGQKGEQRREGGR